MITAQEVQLFENNIPSITDLVTTTTLNKKIIDTENKIPDITKLATKTALNMKDTDHGTSHFIGNQEFNRLTKISFGARIKESVKSLANKAEVGNALDLGDRNTEKLRKFQTFDAIYFLSKSHFEDHGTLNYLEFHSDFIQVF